MNIVSGLWIAFKVLWSSTLGGIVIRAAHRLITTHGKEYVDKLSELAEAKVLEVEKANGPKTGPKKFAEVLEHLMAFAQAEGMKIAASTLGFIVEGVLEELKATGRL